MPGQFRVLVVDDDRAIRSLLARVLERAGWCPGDMVYPWSADLGAVTAGSLTFKYDVEAYENTCRPESKECKGCSLGTGCAYDGGRHVRPRWLTNGFLVLYQ